MPLFLIIAWMLLVAMGELCGTVEKMSMGGKVAVMRGGNREPVRSDCASPHVDQVSYNRLARIGAAARTGASEAYEGQEK
jgi:hypothetical protein